MHDTTNQAKTKKPKKQPTKEAKARYDRDRRMSIVTLSPIDQPLALAWLSSPRPHMGDLDD